MKKGVRKSRKIKIRTVPKLHFSIAIFSSHRNLQTTTVDATDRTLQNECSEIYTAHDFILEVSLLSK